MHVFFLHAPRDLGHPDLRHHHAQIGHAVSQDLRSWEVLPTAVVQAFAGEVFDTRGDGPQATKPVQIDRCRALRSDGPTVLAYYPRWYRPAAPTASIPAESEPARNP